MQGAQPPWPGLVCIRGKWQRKDMRTYFLSCRLLLWIAALSPMWSYGDELPINSAGTPATPPSSVEELNPITAPPPLPSVSTDEQAPLTEPSSSASTTSESSEPGPSTPTPVSEAPEAVSIAKEARTSRAPRYTLTRPAWGVSVTGSLKALGGKDLVASQGGNSTRAIQISAEYQLPFLQSIGVISLGPSVGIYPIFPIGQTTESALGIWEIGGQARYQLRFFREQIFVPLAGFEVQRIAYTLQSGAAGSLIATGPLFGGMLLLNPLEPSSAAELYINHRVSRSYLVGELRGLSGSDAQISFSGLSVFFGLRLEF